MRTYQYSDDGNTISVRGKRGTLLATIDIPKLSKKFFIEKRTLFEIADFFGCSKESLTDAIRYIGFRRPTINSTEKYGRNRMRSTNVAEVGHHFELHHKCYIAEARAMLTGKHWEGHNKCTRLPGDDDILPDFTWMGGFI